MDLHLSCQSLGSAMTLPRQHPCGRGRLEARVMNGSGVANCPRRETVCKLEFSDKGNPPPTPLNPPPFLLSIHSFIRPSLSPHLLPPPSLPPPSETDTLAARAPLATRCDGRPSAAVAASKPGSEMSMVQGGGKWSPAFYEGVLFFGAGTWFWKALEGNQHENNILLGAGEAVWSWYPFLLWF